MPWYEYQCLECGHLFEETRPVEDRRDAAMCPHCVSLTGKLLPSLTTYQGNFGSASTSPKTKAFHKGATPLREQLEFDFMKKKPDDSQ